MIKRKPVFSVWFLAVWQCLGKYQSLQQTRLKPPIYFVNPTVATEVSEKKCETPVFVSDLVTGRLYCFLLGGTLYVVWLILCIAPEVQTTPNKYRQVTFPEWLQIHFPTITEWRHCFVCTTPLTGFCTLIIVRAELRRPSQLSFNILICSFSYSYNKECMSNFHLQWRISNKKKIVTTVFIRAQVEKLGKV